MTTSRYALLPILGCIFVVFLLSFTNAIKCWTCENEDSIENCNKNGKLMDCNGAQNTCGIEVRGNGVWKLKYNVKIFKFCKQHTACMNVQNQNMQNAWNLTQCNPTFPNSVCRCCCQSDNCNVGELECLGDEESAQEQCAPSHSAPKYGSLICSDDNKRGSVCSFNCKKGFFIQGDSRSTCQDNGKWDRIAPTCQPIICPKLGKLEYGSIKCDKNALIGSVCSLRCIGGYTLVGEDVSVCGESKTRREIGQWSTKGQFCKQIQCSTFPETPENGYMACSEGKKIGSVCEYSCDVGYQMEGYPGTICTEKFGVAQWNYKTPSCKRMQCGRIPLAPEDGEVTCTDWGYLGSKCRFSCTKGFNKIGAKVSICIEGKGLEPKWNRETPVCERKECSKYLHAPTNGFMKCSNEKYYGSACEFSCDHYYDLVGSVISTCAENKASSMVRWTHRIPKCIRKQCSHMLMAPENGNMICSDERYYGSVCAFSCNKEYKRIGTSYTMCGASIKKSYGKEGPEWERDAPICKRKQCGPAPTITTGFMLCTDGNFIGSKCEYWCEDFHARVGHLYTTCVEDKYGYMKWTNEEAPKCERITCSPIKPLVFGDMQCTDEEYVNSKCSFQCNVEDYKLYPRSGYTITCQNDTNWSEVPPCCARSCPPYAVMDLIVILGSSSSIGKPSWKVMLDFVNNIFNLFVVQTDAMNFGVVRYNKEIDADTRINLNEFPDDLEMLKKLVSKMPYNGQGTRTGQAITYVSEHMLQADYGNRPNVPDVVLVITDGRSQDDVSKPAKVMRENGVLTFALGITPTNGKLDMKQLRDIAGSESRLFLAKEGFDTLTPEFAAEISENICGNPCERKPY